MRVRNFLIARHFPAALAALVVGLAFAVDRGRVDVINHKSQGEARLRIRIKDRPRSGEVVLNTPGTHIALMLFGRWPAGVPFTKTPKPGDGPTLHLLSLVYRGEV